MKKTFLAVVCLGFIVLSGNAFATGDRGGQRNHYTPPSQNTNSCGTNCMNSGRFNVNVGGESNAWGGTTRTFNAGTYDLRITRGTADNGIKLQSLGGYEVEGRKSIGGSASGWGSWSQWSK